MTRVFGGLIIDAIRYLVVLPPRDAIAWALVEWRCLGRESGLLKEAEGCGRFWRSSVFGLGRCKRYDKTVN
jgi:hypothetical protein